MLSKKSKILSLSRVSSNSDKYDIKVANNSYYFANDILVHNTDGQALAISYKDGRLITARNKGEYKNFGAMAADKNAIAAKFANRGELTNAFTFAFNDLENAISKLNPKDIDAIFQNGKCFMHIEIIYSPTTNVIPYDTNLLVFHNVTEYDQNGEPMGQDRAAADKVAKLIADVNQNVQSIFKIQGSPYINIKANTDLSSEISLFKKNIDNVIKKWKMHDSNTLLDYYRAEWLDVIKSSKQKFTDAQIEGLLQRWTEDNKDFRINDKTIDDKDALTWALNFDKTSVEKTMYEIKKPIELIISQVAVLVMKSYQMILAANPDSAAQQIKSQLQKTIEDIKVSDNASAIEKLRIQMQKLNALGGDDMIFPAEGVCFNYKGKLYKLTGTFAPVNQILGALKY
jgi:hypothetical protein